MFDHVLCKICALSLMQLLQVIILVYIQISVSSFGDAVTGKLQKLNKCSGSDRLSSSRNLSVVLAWLGLEAPALACQNPAKAKANSLGQVKSRLTPVCKHIKLVCYTMIHTSMRNGSHKWPVTR